MESAVATITKTPITGNPMEVEPVLPRLFEKSVIIHRDENGFGLRVKGQAPVFVEHVHENGAAWRAGVRRFDKINKVNGQLVTHLDHKEVVLMIKDCPKFVGLTLLGSVDIGKISKFGEESALASATSDLIQPISSSSSAIQASHKRHKSLPAANSNGPQQYFSNISSAPLVDLTPLSASTNLHSRQLNSRPSLGSVHTQNFLSSATTRRSESVSLVSKPHKSQTKDNNLMGDTTIPINGHQFHLVFGVREPRCMGCGTAMAESLRYTCSICEISAHKSCLKKVAEGPCRSNSEKFKAFSAGSRVKIDSFKSQQDEKILDESDLLRSRILQSASTSSLPANGVENKKSSLPIRPSNRRLEIIRELLDTEKAHTDRLKHLDDLFYRPMKSESLVSQEQLRLVFSCHKTLLKIHKQIYRVLLSSQYNRFEEPLIGPALVQIFEGDIAKRLERAASTFCSCQSTNTELLNKLSRRDTKVGDFLAQAANQQLIGRLGLKDLLASCFQRLTKYPLLLENLLKSTPSAMIDGANFGDEHECIRRALYQSRQILIRVNEAVKMANSQTKLREIWKKTDKHSSVPMIDISKQQLVHDGPLTLRLSKRSFEVYILLLNDYLIILIREHQDKYKLKAFSPDGKSTNQSCYSPVFVIDEHLTTRDSATDENGFYLLCKKKDDSRIYELGAQSPADRSKWREKIQWTVENQISKLHKNNRRQSYESTSTKSGSDISSRPDFEDVNLRGPPSLALTKDNKPQSTNEEANPNAEVNVSNGNTGTNGTNATTNNSSNDESLTNASKPTKVEGTISYVGEDDVLIMPSRIEKSEIVIRESVRMVSVQQKLKLIDRDLKSLMEQKLALMEASNLKNKDNNNLLSDCFRLNKPKDISSRLDSGLEFNNSSLGNNNQLENWLSLAMGAMNVSSLIISNDEGEVQQKLNPDNLREAVVNLRTQIDSFLQTNRNDTKEFTDSTQNITEKVGSD